MVSKPFSPKKTICCLMAGNLSIHPFLFRARKARIPNDERLVGGEVRRIVVWGRVGRPLFIRSFLPLLREKGQFTNGGQLLIDNFLRKKRKRLKNRGFEFRVGSFARGKRVAVEDDPRGSGKRRFGRRRSRSFLRTQWNNILSALALSSPLPSPSTNFRPSWRLSSGKLETDSRSFSEI